MGKNCRLCKRRKRLLKKLLKLTGGTPSAKTYERVISLIDCQELNKIEIIKRLNLENVICTWDALNTQKANVKAVISKGGDYCVTLKANQENFYKDVQDYFDEDRLLIIKSGYEGGYSLLREKSHSQIITYEYFQTEKVKWYAEYKEWEKLKSIGLVVKTIEAIGV